MSRLYITDLDGTLLNSNGKISDECISRINGLISKGLQFTVATGRHYLSAKELIKDLNLEFPIITCNGAYVNCLKTDKSLFSCHFESDLLSVLEKEIINQEYTYYSNGVYGKEDYWSFSKLTNPGMDWFRENIKEYKNATCYTNLNLANTESVNITVIERQEVIEEFNSYILSKYKGQVRTSLSANPYSPGWHWLFIQPILATKAQGIQKLKSIIPSLPSDITFYGDEDNDKEAIEYAQDGVCVENARDSLIKLSDRTIGHHNHQAVSLDIESKFNEFKY